MVNKKIRLGIDLDGVIVGKPFFVPKSLLEWLHRSHTNHNKKYRFPKTKIEIWIRILSHHWLLRPAIKENLKIIKKLSERKGLEIYVISSRYSFLKNRTKSWFEKNGISDRFTKVCLNLKDKQPHVFKEEQIKKNRIDYFLEDDPVTSNYLKKKLRNTKIIDVKKTIQLDQIAFE